MAPGRKKRYGWASHAIALSRRVRSWALPAAEYYRGLWGVVREGLLRPARIAWIAPVVTRIAVSTAAIDE
jgi:hypothetical protein